MREIFCTECGMELTELLPPAPIGLQPERVPCPNCGSTRRTYGIALTATVGQGLDIVPGYAPVGVTEQDEEPSPAPPPKLELAVGTFTRKLVWSKHLTRG